LTTQPDLKSGEKMNNKDEEKEGRTEAEIEVIKD